MAYFTKNMANFLGIFQKIALTMLLGTFFIQVSGEFSPQKKTLVYTPSKALSHSLHKNQPDTQLHLMWVLIFVKVRALKFTLHIKILSFIVHPLPQCTPVGPVWDKTATQMLQWDLMQSIYLYGDRLQFQLIVQLCSDKLFHPYPMKMQQRIN